jgi:hypothetical protein
MIKRSKTVTDRSLENIIANYNAVRVGLTSGSFIDDLVKKTSEGIIDNEGTMKRLVKKSRMRTDEAIYDMLCRMREVLYGSGLQDLVPASALSDGFEIASKCNVKDLAKMDAEWDKKCLLKYIQLAKAKDKDVDGVMTELEPWNDEIRKVFPPLNLLVTYMTRAPEPEKKS